MFTITYLLLIVFLVLFSWAGNIYGVTLSDGTLLPNLLSQEGIRWLVRHSIDNISAAPLAEVLLALILIGALRSSGLWSSLVHRESRSIQRTRHALHMALILFAACILAVLIGITPGGNLLSVTGHIAGGPFASGWLFLLTLTGIAPCILFGYMSDQWHTREELFIGITSEITSCTCYLVTLIVASQLIAMVRYIHLFELLKASSITQDIIETLVYIPPLIALYIKKHFTHDTSSAE